MARDFEPTPEQKNLGKFLENLWTLSSQNLEGENTLVLRTAISDKDERVLRGPFPPIEIQLTPQIVKNLDKWQGITGELLARPPDKRKKLNLMFWDEGINITTAPLFLGEREGKEVILLLKYSSLVGVAHMQSQLGTRFPPNAEEGRPGVLFRITEVFTDSRKKLLKIHGALVEEAQKKDFDRYVRETVLGTRLSTTKPVGELLQKLDSSLLTFIEVVGRITFYDTPRKVYQPIDLAGFQIIETLDGTIYANRLDSPSGHDSWKPFASNTEGQIAIDYARNFNLLDKNLTILANLLRQPSR